MSKFLEIVKIILLIVFAGYSEKRFGLEN